MLATWARVMFQFATHAGVALYPSYPLIKPDLGVDTRTRRNIENRIMALWAGTLAAEIHTGRENPEGGESDREEVFLLGEYVAPNEEELAAFTEWLRLRTRSLLWDPFVWRRVEAVAELLLKETELTAAEVRRAIKEAGVPKRSARAADPEPTDPEPAKGRS